MSDRKKKFRFKRLQRRYQRRLQKLKAAKKRAEQTQPVKK